GERNQKIELRDDLHEIVAMRHAVEALRLTRTDADTDHRHVEGLADWSAIFYDQANAENADGLAGEQRGRPAFPLALVVRNTGARQIARERQHIGDGRFLYWRAVNAAHIGDQPLFAERRQVDDVVDAGAERLDPFEPGCV